MVVNELEGDKELLAGSVAAELWNMGVVVSLMVTVIVLVLGSSPVE